MAPKHHPTPLSGGDRKALRKELGKARAMANILATQSAEMRAKGEALIQQADRLLCESWNERMWSDGEPIDPSPTIDQAVNGGFPWLEIQCARCKTPSDVDLAAMKHPPSDLCVRSRGPFALSKVREGRTAPRRHLVAACREAAPFRCGGVGCRDGGNHRPLPIPTMNGRPQCRRHPPTSNLLIPSKGVRSSTAHREDERPRRCSSSRVPAPERPIPTRPSCRPSDR